MDRGVLDQMMGWRGHAEGQSVLTTNGFRLTFTHCCQGQTQSVVSVETQQRPTVDFNSNLAVLKYFLNFFLLFYFVKFQLNQWIVHISFPLQANPKTGQNNSRNKTVSVARIVFGVNAV